MEDIVSGEPEDTLIRKFWNGQRMISLDQSNEIDRVFKIVEISLEERILSPVTAFLALEPEDPDTVVCEHCDGDGPITNIESNSLEFQEVNIFPNPVESKITIELLKEEFQPDFLEIFNLKGELVYRLKLETALSSKMIINLDFLDTGFYQMVLTDGVNRISTKLNKI